MNRHDYLEQLTEQIRCRRARPMIEEEIRGHIDEQKQDYMADGMTEAEAEEAAVREMGDPVEVGVELDRIHRPKLDKTLVAVISILAVLGMITQMFLAKAGEENGAAGVLPSYDMVATLLSMGVWTLLGMVLMLVLFYADYTLLGKYALWAWGAVAAGLFCYRLWGNRVNGGYPKTVIFIYAMVPVFAGVVYYYRGKGTRGFLKSLLWGMGAAMLLLLVPNVGKPGLVLLLVLSEATVLLAAVRKRWFGRERKKKTLCVLGMCLFLPMALVLLLFCRNGGQLAEYQKQRLERFGKPSQDFVYVQVKEWFDKDAGEAEEGNIETEVTEESLLDGMIWWDAVRSDFLWIYMFKQFGYGFGIGCILLVTVFFYWLFRMIHRQKNQLGYMISLGCAVMLLLQTLVYAAVNMGLLPRASVYMPFFSYGRINSFITYLYMGLFLSISSNRMIVPAK